MNKQDRINTIVDNRLASHNFRHDVYAMVPENTERVLEFGYGDGSLILRLQRDKGVKEIYGIELNKKPTIELFTGGWGIDLNQPDADIGEEFHGYFDYMVSMNVLEHVYDPWYVLAKLRKYLKKEGKAIIEVPNAQCWESVYRLLIGDFPYTSGAHFDFTHIRWYTLKSFAEILGMAGMRVEGINLLLNNVNLDRLNKVKELRTIQLPPPEVNVPGEKITLHYPMDVKTMYPLFLAPRMIFSCVKTDEDIECSPTRADGRLEIHRHRFENPCRLVPQMFPDPVHPSILDKITITSDLEDMRPSP